MSATLLLTGLLALGVAADEPKPAEDTFQADPAWKPIGEDLWFDAKAKRLVLRARVSLREGYLEHLLCATNSKEHESILATAAPARLIHAGLLLTGAEPGHPVQFRPEFRPPRGTPIAIELEWVEDGKVRRANARDWVAEEKTGKLLAKDWVFAGSELFQDPETKEMIYAADAGDLFTVANFTSAILDVPFASSADDTSRGFVAHTAKVPPRGTLVTMSLRVAPPAPTPPAGAAPAADPPGRASGTRR